LTFLGCLVLAVGAAIGCKHDDACSVMPDAPPATGSADPCRYWLAPPVVGNPPCPAVGPWNGAPLVFSSGGKPGHCRYEWSDPNTAPAAADVAALPASWTQACTYVTPQGAADHVTLWARQALRDAVGEKLPSTAQIDVGVVVLDTVPEGQDPPPDEARHGQTLARMIADLACETPGDCPVEVRNAMALPMSLDPVTRQPFFSATGGSFGLLSDVSNALWAEANRYRGELRLVALGQKAPLLVPARVVVVSAFGFENEPGSSLCDTSPATSSNRAVVAMHEAFEASACLGMMHVSAAGNSNGGARPQGGLLCPARWDHAVRPSEGRCEALWGPTEWAQIEKDHALFVDARAKGEAAQLFLSKVVDKPTDALLSVAGVDYHGSPLVLSRADACAEAVAIGIGGIGWIDDGDVPPALFGSSVSAAVAGARLALRWRKDLGATATDLLALTPSENRKISFARTSSCDGAPALSCAGDIPWIGEPKEPVSGQNPEMPDKDKNELRDRPDVQKIEPPGEAVCAAKIPHCVSPSVASTTLVWPQPVEPICVKCGLFVDPVNNGYPELWLDGNTALTARDIASAVLIIEDAASGVVLTKPLDATTVTSRSTVALVDVRPSLLENARAWISVYTTSGRSLSQQIFVIQ
jgi:hypothetical protein